MSTQLQKNKKKKQLPKIPDLRVGIVVAEWNEHITEALLKGALDVFEKEGYSQNAILVDRVPGTVELTYGAARMINTMDIDAIIVFGCVIRGDTPHFDYVCQSVTQGVTTLNADGDVPVIFGVLTVDNEEQALERAGGKLGNKGAEAAETAIKMVYFSLRYSIESPATPYHGSALS